MVGVNSFTEGNEEPLPPMLYIDPEVEVQQKKRLEEVRRARSQAAVTESLERIKADAARPEVNLMPAIIDAVKAMASVGEIVKTLESVFGTWTETPAM